MKKNNFCYKILLVVCLLYFSGCSAIALKTYGIRKPKLQKEEKIFKFSNKFHIPAENGFLLDTTYLSYLMPLHETHKDLFKNHMQPLQISVYDKEGKMVAYHVNCYAGGFPNLTWNSTGFFDTFPPASAAPVDSVLDFKSYMNFIKTFCGKTVEVSGYEDADFNMIVTWSVFMNRQSKRLILLIQNYVHENAKDKKVNIIFVNNDNLFGSFQVEVE